MTAYDPELERAIAGDAEARIVDKKIDKTLT